MNLKNAQELNNALNSAGLKAKHISGENFNKLILSLKPKLKRALVEMGEKEKQVAEAMDILVGEQIVTTDQEQAREYFDKVKDFHKDFSFEHELNFIPENELKEYVKEQDTNVAAIICEYLLKA